MKFTPFDIGTYLVRSGSRHDVTHLVSLLPDEYYGCSCEGYDFSAPWNTCSHFRRAMRLRQSGRLRMIVGMKGRVR